MLQDFNEYELDHLMIANIDFIKSRYDHDILYGTNGEITIDIFKTESPAMTADWLERFVKDK